MTKKIKSVNSIVRIAEVLKKENKTIGFTNGVFDILHPGHVNYLERAKKYVDILILGLNSDKSVKKTKGKFRPINNQWARACVLASLKDIDYIVIFDAQTPYELIAKIKPDYLFKGSDWESKKIVGRDILESYGGKVVRLPYLKGYSTTQLLKKIWRIRYIES